MLIHSGIFSLIRSFALTISLFLAVTCHSFEMIHSHRVDILLHLAPTKLKVLIVGNSKLIKRSMKQIRQCWNFKSLNRWSGSCSPLTKFSDWCNRFFLVEEVLQEMFVCFQRAPTYIFLKRWSSTLAKVVTVDWALIFAKVMVLRSVTQS